MSEQGTFEGISGAFPPAEQTPPPSSTDDQTNPPEQEPEEAPANKGKVGSFVGVDPQYQNFSSHVFAPLEAEEADDADEEQE